ncbi:DDE-type integrase/transposase/recombinase [Eggerthella lenta]|uniref:zinc-ribbon domain-containing protein n=1 Tax=Eggerthella lenta TaxID=84112 RepID=UPI001C11D25F|nr:zinc-ribbon domain-containing protein [Eggerthella lenta]MBU5399286.1 DDE-type integrase/transposase/recombinase [Eggerthella lenta]
MSTAYPYREIIEMQSIGISQAKVGFLCGCGSQKVKSITTRAKELGLGWPVPTELTDDELALLVDPHERFRCCQPDFARIADEVSGKLKIEKAESAYELYLRHSKEDGGIPYARVTFDRKLRAWLSATHPKIKMAINWHNAECCQLDWAGKTLYIHGDDGRKTPAYLFVATLPFSDYTFVRASLDMKMMSWLEHNMAAFEFFGGVPLFTIIDNLRVGVTFKRDGKVINEHYQDLANHYDTVVLPAKSYSPTWKGAVELHVNLFANGLISMLEQMTFTSISQLNAAIEELLPIYNDRPTARAGGRSRRQMFLAEEAHALQPLPAERYVPVVWKKCTASKDAVVAVRGNYYGVPERYADAPLSVCITDGEVAVFTRGREQCIARYHRREDGAETFDGLAGVCPDRFCPLDEWAVATGRAKIIDQWDVERNGTLTPHDIVCRSEKRVWWRCSDCGFSWKEAPARRRARSFDDCLACCGVELIPGKNDLATLRPDIAAEWSERNPMPASRVFPDFHQMFWWKGSCGHAWRAPISKRTGSSYGALCPYCSGQKVLKGFNDVATLAPELAKLWHPSKNRHFQASRVPVNSHREVYLWNGALTHVWRQSPYQWLTENDREDILAPFESLIAEAKEKDEKTAEMKADARRGLARGKAVLKWTRFLQKSDLLVSFEQYCHEFGHEDLLAEWDKERNGELTPADVTRASSDVVWWKSETCGHAWPESVRSRAFRGAGCIYCNRLRILPGYSTAECLDASLIAKWHPTKNGELTPDQVSDRTTREIWWQCPKCGYEWQENLRLTHKNARQCPNCSHEKRYGFKVEHRNALAIKRADIAAQWDPWLNYGLKLDDALTGSAVSVWWRGECGHVWMEPISVRTARVDASCPYCANRKLLSGFNDIESTHPELLVEWAGDLNGSLTPDVVKANSSDLVWWRGECGHVWQASPARRAEGDGCPICSNHRILVGFNDLASRYPEIASQWADDLNDGLTAQDIPYASGRRSWWRCEFGHTWQLPVCNRTALKDTGCPVCGNRQVLKGFNDLKTTHPKIAKTWHPTKNSGVRATDVMANTCKPYWWKCEKGHEWRIPVINRTKNPNHDPGCPFCHNRKVWPGFNDLETLYPIVAQQLYAPRSKGLQASQLLAGSGKVVWWKPPGCNHVYPMPVYQRVAASQDYCPICAGRRVPERPIDLN